MPEREEKEARQNESRKKTQSERNMAAQSQGIKQLMAAEKEAAQIVANARKSELRAFRR